MPGSLERPLREQAWSSGQTLAIGASLVIASLLVAARLASPGIEDMGDAINHYMFARHAWKHPELFLDQWGKPLFTLLASPFAQMGYSGMAVFNALLCVVATIAASGILRRSGTWSMLLFPVLIMLTPEVVHLVRNGMTEILFGAMALLAVRLLADGRPVAGAMTASLTPLCRPEYMAFVPFVAAWLLFTRNWKALPWSGLGIGAYTLVGWGMTGDPLCWVHNDPYDGEHSPYGHGNAWQFVLDSPPAYGWALVVLFIAALFFWPWITARDREQSTTHLLLLCTAGLPTIAILAAHAWAWHTGTHHSAGLTRVLVSSVPLAAVFALFTLGRGLQMRSRLAIAPWVLIPLAVAGGLWQVLDRGNLIQQLDNDGKTFHAAIAVAAKARGPETRVFATNDGYTAFLLDMDRFDEARFRTLRGEQLETFLGPGDPGDLVVWESRFGPNECHMPIERLLEDDGLKVLRTFSTEATKGSYEVWVLQRRAVDRTPDPPRPSPSTPR